MNQRLHRAFHGLGFDLVRYPGRHAALGRRAALLRSQHVDLVLDVGANEGQYASDLRRIGYRGRIVSFEPLAAPFYRLARAADRDPLWEARNMALGSSDGEAQINVAGNSVSSSFLGMLPAHLAAAPASRYVGTEAVTVHRLDSIATSVLAGAARPFLKIDAQGFEEEVLDGAEQTLRSLVGLQLEVQLQPLYDGAPELRDLLAWFTQRGFDLAGIEPGFLDTATGALLQFDGIWVARRPGAI